MHGLELASDDLCWPWSRVASRWLCRLMKVCPESPARGLLCSVERLIELTELQGLIFPRFACCPVSVPGARVLGLRWGL